MSRTTRKQIEGAFRMLTATMREQGYETRGLALEHNGAYGGWRVEAAKGSIDLGSGRMGGGEFYQALRLAEDLFGHTPRAAS